MSVQVSDASSTNRESCAEISGTRYHSREERIWYETNCLTALAVAPAAPVATQPVSSYVPEQFPNEAAAQFAAGYRQAGGPEQYLSHILYNVMPCESDYNPYAVSYGGPYYGLMQFSSYTWYSVGGGDWFNPYQQGYNTAMLVNSTDPTTQWPYCWFVWS
jgi:hypothetical protein